MVKIRTKFVCQSCGAEFPKWSGQCSDCGSWNSLIEEKVDLKKNISAKAVSGNKPIPLHKIEAEDAHRFRTGYSELDRVLGGGIVPGSVILIAGDPGIGKSTLLLQMAGQLNKQKLSCLYVSGEESPAQIKNRAKRFDLGGSELPVLVETELESILYEIENSAPKVVIIDSIQSIYSQDINGAPGQVSQIRECSSQLFRSAKEKGWAIFLVGHITKEGSIAGPKILEHTVDVVVYFEGDQFHQYRMLRSLKNRFGATNEIGLFNMAHNGLSEVTNPSELFISDNHKNHPGVVIVSSYEGSRAILAEVQALVSRSNYGVPQRTVAGFDHRRLALILAILEKHTGLNFATSDVFIKIAAGLRIDDPGIDLGIAVSVFSSFTDTRLPEKSLFIGELGLNGFIRFTTNMERRISEAEKLGFRQVYLPKGGAKYVNSSKLNITEYQTIHELIKNLS